MVKFLYKNQNLKIKGDRYYEKENNDRFIINRYDRRDKG